MPQDKPADLEVGRRRREYDKGQTSLPYVRTESRLSCRENELWADAHRQVGLRHSEDLAEEEYILPSQPVLEVLAPEKEASETKSA